MTNFFGFAARWRQQIQTLLIQKRLYQVAPDLRPVPNPLSREYLLMVQQYSRLAFVDSIELLKTESGWTWWMRLGACFFEYLRLKATTAIVTSLILEQNLIQNSGDIQP